VELSTELAGSTDIYQPTAQNFPTKEECAIWLTNEIRDEVWQRFKTTRKNFKTVNRNMR
jgi:hypothetical protein